ncbi:MAG TPA: RsmB/NOP family class I SAM-dependent RNA methyltransferase [Candidatus Gracilibacteria bacterium]|nr:RsmB/NOP family class I SAM-dependent RNA methyltransferase [Candidatus Gracilibacteria bacterium]
MEKLAPSLITLIKDHFGQDLSLQIFQGFETKRPSSARLNTIKSNSASLENEWQELGIKYQKIDQIQNAYLLDENGIRIAHTPGFLAGHFYLQSLSSQLPALVLDPQKGEKILDMTAAPGSKTSQIAALMQNQGQIVANELSKIRYDKLVFTIKNQGVKIAKTRKGDGRELASIYPSYFDRILLDAPCSAIGRIQIDKPKSYQFWQADTSPKNANLQLELLNTAAQCLKANGILVYSTCTLSHLENEGAISQFLTNHPDFTILPLGLDYPFVSPPDSTYLKQFPALRQGGYLFPNNQQEGFFVIKMQKA